MLLKFNTDKTNFSLLRALDSVGSCLVVEIMTNTKRRILYFVYVLIAIGITLAIYFPLKANERPLVTLTDGSQVRGLVLKSRLKNNFYAFRAIRYGESPIGELRFKVIILLRKLVI